MNRRLILWSVVGVVALAGVIGGVWIYSLPPAQAIVAPPPIPKAEADATLASLKPPKRQRPLIAIVGINDATGVTDYLMPYGILRRADVADVVLLATATGISASIPIALTLIEAIAGREKAETVSSQIGLTQWDANHDSSAFTFTRPFALTAIGNSAAFWNREQFGIELTPGIDEVSLALVADAWSRTYRSRALTFARTGDARETLNGLRIVPDRVEASWPADTLIPAIGDRQPVRALDDTLDGIAARYGSRTAYFVTMQLEYPKPVTSR